MAINDIVQSIAEARVDARSLSEFVFKPEGFKVARRLAPPIDTLQFYINRFDATKATSDAYIATIPTIVNDAINNTAIEGGVLSDTFVTVTSNRGNTIPRTLRDVLSDTISIKDYGAKPFVGNPAGAFNNHTAITNAVNATPDGGTLNIPSGNYMVQGGKILVKDKNINIICDGVLYFDGHHDIGGTLSTGIGFVRTPTEVLGSELLSTPKVGTTKLEFTTAPITNASEYIVSIRSTEALFAAQLTGLISDYKKEQTLDFVRDDFTLRLSSIYEYVDKNSITLSMYKKGKQAEVQLDIQLFNTNEESHLPELVSFSGASNMNITKLRITDSNNTNIYGSGVYMNRSMFLSFDRPFINVFKHPRPQVNTSYPIHNNMSSFITFNAVSSGYGGSGNLSPMYIARHGRMVVFNNCSIGIDDHYGHDYFINDSILPLSVSFAGGDLTLSNCTGTSVGYMVVGYGQAPFGNGRIVFNNCKTNYGYISIPSGTSIPERNTVYNPYREIVINGGECVAHPSSAMISAGLPDGGFTTIKPINVTVSNLRYTVPSNYSEGYFGCFMQSELAHGENIKLYDVVSFSNVHYVFESAGTTTIRNEGHMFFRMVLANDIYLNNTYGINLVGCKANSVTINGGVYGLPDKAVKTDTLTDISQMDNDSVDIRINNAVLSEKASIFTKAGDTTTVKNYFIFNSQLNALLMSNTSEAVFIRVLRNNYSKKGKLSWLSYNITNYTDPLYLKDRHSVVSTTIPSLALGEITTTTTTAFQFARVTIAESIVAAIDKDTKGLQVRCWVSAQDVISYYVENPANNPNGVVNLGAVKITFRVA